MPTRPRIAAYDELITLETPTLTPDGQGGTMLTLVAGESRWARVERLPATPRDGVRGVEKRYRIRFREVFALSEHTHLIWQGQRLSIISIQREPGRFGSLSVECRSEQGV